MDVLTGPSLAKLLAANEPSGRETRSAHFSTMCCARKTAQRPIVQNAPRLPRSIFFATTTEGRKRAQAGGKRNTSWKSVHIKKLPVFDRCPPEWHASTMRHASAHCRNFIDDRKCWPVYALTSSMTPTNSSSTYVSFRNFSWLIFFCKRFPIHVASTATGTHMSTI